MRETERERDRERERERERDAPTVSERTFSKMFSNRQKILICYMNIYIYTY